MRVAIAGAGAVGRSIARELIENGHKVLLIDKDPSAIHPDRVPDAASAYDWSTPRSWSFEPLDAEAFGAVELARRAGRAAGTAPAASVNSSFAEYCVAIIVGAPFNS